MMDAGYGIAACGLLANCCTLFVDAVVPSPIVETSQYLRAGEGRRYLEMTPLGTQRQLASDSSAAAMGGPGLQCLDNGKSFEISPEPTAANGTVYFLL
ncbi:hypothetical protein WICPIJ_009513 [Wickerhamomyces pijperi]|uniref:Uncharacterized protein n=1 Tax=Wickerhamomyces pijperi TaxID=599730 RepID=A0A9P8TDJ2_WICPI|nr:hypothetical protein WICPIJ_009513 [Wickerhamomyces pijperi]